MNNAVRGSLPTLAILIGASVWGLIWYPLRILASLGVALTLTPSLCVAMLKRGAMGKHGEPGRFFGAFNRWFARITDRYEDGVAWMIRRGVVGVVLFHQHFGLELDLVGNLTGISSTNALQLTVGTF